MNRLGEAYIGILNVNDTVIPAGTIPSGKVVIVRIADTSFHTAQDTDKQSTRYDEDVGRTGNRSFVLGPPSL